MSGKTYGYVRISNGNHKEDTPVAAMRELGLDMDQIIIEKQPEKHSDRPLYQNLVGRLQTGDALIEIRQGLVDRSKSPFYLVNNADYETIQ